MMLIVVLFVSVRRGLTHYVHWLAGAGLFFVSALVIGAAYLIIRPDVSLTTILVVLAVEMLFFALVDIIVNRVSQPR